MLRNYFPKYWRVSLRTEYNSGNKSPIKFYTLLCYAFNNQIRFNKNDQYNMPFGKDKSCFNEKLREKFIIFCDKLHTIHGEFLNLSFQEVPLFDLSSNDFVYADPPYYNSFATYNENGGWTIEDEEMLLHLLGELNAKGVNFGLSNNLKDENPLLNKWKSKYHVHYLNYSYNNCNFQKKSKSMDIEVLITNY